MKWSVDNAHSLAEFSVKHMMVTTVKGRFGKVTGTLDFEEAGVAQSYVEAEIDTASVDTRDEKRDGHLRSADFFDVEKYPTITFKSTKVEEVRPNEFKVTGDLTIKDVTKPVTLDVEYSGTGKNPWGMTVAGFSASTTINRKDFGLNWNVALETGGFLVSDNIKINLELEAVAVPETAPVA